VATVSAPASLLSLASLLLAASPLLLLFPPVLVFLLLLASPAFLVVSCAAVRPTADVFLVLLFCL
jgi:hypothetical protein